ncbi:hypothetical protein BC943DRAFT_333372 [Umbelopsis sp. AD052]|nr:hypothetical protein BC943DRAFT_333372 [Umbelopsis sp. AD052]
MDIDHPFPDDPMDLDELDQQLWEMDIHYMDYVMEDVSSSDSMILCFSPALCAMSPLPWRSPSPLPLRSRVPSSSPRRVRVPSSSPCRVPVPPAAPSRYRTPSPSSRRAPVPSAAPSRYRTPSPPSRRARVPCPLPRRDRAPSSSPRRSMSPALRRSLSPLARRSRSPSPPRGRRLSDPLVAVWPLSRPLSVVRRHMEHRVGRDGYDVAAGRVASRSPTPLGRLRSRSLSCSPPPRPRSRAPSPDAGLSVSCSSPAMSTAGQYSRPASPLVRDTTPPTAENVYGVLDVMDMLQLSNVIQELDAGIYRPSSQMANREEDIFRSPDPLLEARLAWGFFDDPEESEDPPAKRGRWSLPLKLL